MKQFIKGSMALLVAGLLTVYSCAPNDDKGGQDQNNSGGEGEIDSSRLIRSDTSGASISVPYFIKPRHSINKKQGS
jgi:hypothetical protein